MRLLKSQSGVTLVELMSVVFTGGLVLVMALGMMLNITDTSTNFNLSVDAEVEEMGAANAFQMAFGQATQLKYYTAGPLETYVDPNGKGAIKDYDSDADFGVRPVSAVAVFMRDRQVSDVASPSTVSSQILPTAVFFQPPTATTWGVAYLALGDSALEPTRSQLHFDGLVRMRVFNISTYSPSGTNPTAGDPVTSFDMELTFRRFLGAVKPDQKMFCPTSAIASCPGIGAYRDAVRLFKVNVRDNILAASPNSPLPPATPVGGRMYDLIHFFVLGRAVELQ